MITRIQNCKEDFVQWIQGLEAAHRTFLAIYMIIHPNVRTLLKTSNGIVIKQHAITQYQLFSGKLKALVCVLILLELCFSD